MEQSIGCAAATCAGNVSTQWISYFYGSPGFPGGNIGGLAVTVENVTVATGAVDVLLGPARPAFSLMTLLWPDPLRRFGECDCQLTLSGGRVHHCGRRVTRAYSWRGIVHQHSCYRQ